MCDDSVTQPCFRTWMEIIFETLEPNLVGLLEYGVKSDPT